MSRKEKENDSLGNRMKSYEVLSTSRQLMPNCPVYARIDGRAFHTFTRGLKKPFSETFISAMQYTCMKLVEATGANLGYVQSDEISLGWKDFTKAPFEGRIQKLESVLASMASAFFMHSVWFDVIEQPTDDNLEARCMKIPPTFDCRIFNVPDMIELANCFLWRENDSIKNSISGMALNFYSHKQIQGKSGEEKIAMMKEKGYDFYRDTDEAFLRGTFYRRENYKKVLSDEEVARIPQEQRYNLINESYVKDGKIVREIWSCTRTHVVPVKLPYRLTDTSDVVDVLFGKAEPKCNKNNPTFNLSERG